MLKAGWVPGELLDDMLGVSWFECIDPEPSRCTCHPDLPPRVGLHYFDAVGDVAVVDDEWGPSVSQFQIRTLRDPTSGNEADRWRVAEKLHNDPLFAAKAARVIVGPAGELRRLWTVYRTGAYRERRGQDFELHAGHRRAHLWSV